MTQLTIKPDVRLYHNSELVAVGKAAYVGLFGINIEDCDTTFQKYTRLDMEIGQPVDPSEDNGSGQSRLPVIVTTRSKDVMGLTFIWMDSKMRAKWRPVAAGFLNMCREENALEG